MKTLYLPIMILLVSFSPSMVPAFATGGSAFFMKTNSIGQIYATFDNRGNLANAEIFTYTNSSQFGPFVDPKIVSVVREENALTKSQTSLIYTITASDNSKGTYVLNLGPCFDNILLFVGINESEINPNNIPDFAHGGGFCYMDASVPSDLKITGVSNMIFESSNLTVPEFPFSIPILLISMILLIVIYRIRFRN